MSPRGLARPLAACVLGLWAASPLLAGAGDPSEGTSAVAVLKLPLGSRAASLAGAFTAVAEGAEGALFNPAGLSQLPSPELHFTHHEIFQDLQLELLAAARPFRLRHSLGAHLVNFTSGDIDLTREDSSGAYDPAASQGSYSNSSLVAAVSYAYAPTAWASLGVSLKNIRDSVGGPGGGTEDAWALDLGALYRAGPARLGASAVNLGGRLAGNFLPGALRLGAAADLEPFGLPLLLSAEGVHPLDGGGFKTSVGAEWRALEHLSLDAGYRLGAGRDKAQSGVTMGLGLNWRSFRLAFSFLPYGNLGTLGTFSVTYRFLPAQAPSR